MGKIGIIRNGFLTGLFLQLAIGPVFFYIVNLVLQRTIYDGFAAVAAVTIVDFLYIILAIAGVGKLLEKEKFKKTFGILSSVALIIFGFIIIRGITSTGISTDVAINSTGLVSSFLSVFIITISSPLTIVFFTGIFTAKAVEYNYTKNQLYLFGVSVGSATFLFLSLTVIIFFLLKNAIPVIIIQILNLLVGVVLISYGVIRIINIQKSGNND